MTMFKVDSVVFKLRSSEGFEYKYRIEKGGGLLYAWKATRPVKYEFHGEPDGAGLGVAVSYEKSEGSRGSGSFVAPSSGIHGWYLGEHDRRRNDDHAHQLGVLQLGGRVQVSVSIR